MESEDSACGEDGVEYFLHMIAHEGFVDGEKRGGGVRADGEAAKLKRGTAELGVDGTMFGHDDLCESLQKSVSGFSGDVGRMTFEYPSTKTAHCSLL